MSASGVFAMAELLKMLDSLKTSLSCSICLEIFTNPLSLPCGHTFCQTCIHKLWDYHDPLRGPITCPECRVEFLQRPEPQKNVSLHSMVEALKELEKKLLVAPVESGPKEAGTAVCKEHRQLLGLYCCTDRRCICYKCLVQGCRHHHFEDIEELSEKERRKLSNDFEANGQQKEDTEKEIEAWKQKSQEIKDSHCTLVTRVMSKFDQARQTLEERQRLVVESIRSEEKAALTRVSDHLQHLQHHLQDLNKYRAEAEQLLDPETSDTEFLEGLPLLGPVGCAPVPPNVQLCGTTQMDAVTRILPEVMRLLQEELPHALHPVAGQAGIREISVQSSSMGAAAGICSPIQTSALAPGKLKNDSDATTMSALRTQLLQDYRNLTFDSETANKYFEISHQNSRATHKTSSRANNFPESPKRFQSWQVMCVEGYSEGSHYWEVEISTFFVQIGVAYGSLKRSNETENVIGRNKSSWSLELRSVGHSVWHDGMEVTLSQEKYMRIGVHLDCADSSIAFYGIKDRSLQCLHKFHSVFKEKMYPVFWIGEDVRVKLSHVKGNL